MYAEVLIGKTSGRWVIREHDLIGFSEAQMEKHRTAQRMLETVVNSWEFRQELLSLAMTSTKGFTNAKIYNMIINGAEVLSPDIDNEADISVHAFRRWGRVVGYTMDHTHKTWLNLNFFDRKDFTYEAVATNLFHEWLHKLGFDHKSAKEHSSVPYAASKLVGNLVKHLMNGGLLHDVHDADKQIDVILGSTIPSKPLPNTLVCTRSWRNLWRKKCFYL